MELFKIDPEFLKSVQVRLQERGHPFSADEVNRLVELISNEVVYQFADRLISQVEAILEINPLLTEQEILETVAKGVVNYFGAESATIRIYDPERQEMISYGSYPSLSTHREEAIPFEDTIAGEVVKTQKSYFVPNILKEEKYKNKNIVDKLGIQSMLAIPFTLPRFSMKYVGKEGVIQIYFKEKERDFSPLEGKIAEMFSRRISYVIARKRVQDLQKLNVTKDRIVEQIYHKLGRREGIKMKEVFDLVIPELADILHIQRCSLFSVMADRQHVVLEAGYPEVQHGLGKVFSVREPYIEAVVNQKGPFGEFEHEKIYPTYILITDPQDSFLLPFDLKRFLRTQEINSVLYVPLKVDDVVNHFLVFDAKAHRKGFTEEEIEIFHFLGMELIKGWRLERMDDILHDFKNPAIAAAGFAKRVRRLLEAESGLTNRSKIDQALDIIVKETSRIQELALTLYGIGKEEILDLTEKLKERFTINEQAIKELKRENIRLIRDRLEAPLKIRCFPLHIQRVLDNLLNNASQAIPEEGGELVIRSYRKDSWAVAEITNSGQIQNKDIDRLVSGESKGRGLHITTRLIKRMGGKMEVESSKGRTTFRVVLPFISEQPFPPA
jgi:signal transduction histidine kinase